MDSSSEDEGVTTHRRSKGRKILDSDDEVDEGSDDKQVEATEDFVLRLSDEDGEDSTHNMASLKAKIEASLDDQNVGSIENQNTGNSVKDSDIASKVDAGLESAQTVALTGTHPELEESGQKQTVSHSKFIGKDEIMKKLNALADSDSESDVEDNLESEPQISMKMKSVTKNEHSSESDADSENDSHLQSIDEIKKSMSNPKSKKSKPKSERKSKTAAKNAMLEIKAESQRQLRQSRIGLPYHVPKQRSLSEFLNRRKSSSNMPIKGPVEQLAAVWREIEDREKRVEEFYKSESDSESDSDERPQSAKLSEKMEETDLVHENSCGNTNLEVDLKDHSSHDQVNTAESNVMLENTSSSKDGMEKDLSHAMTQKNCNDLAYESQDSGIVEEISPAKVEKMDHLPEKQSISDFTVSPEFSDPSASKESEILTPVISNDSALDETSSTEINVASSAENSSKILPHPQDSQDISLHYSETQGLEGNLFGNIGPAVSQQQSSSTKENSTSDMPKTSKNVLEKNDVNNAVCSKIEVQTEVRREGEAKQSMSWEELNSAMKLSDDELQLELGGEIPSKKSLSSGPRLSLKGAPDDVIDLDDVNPIMSKTPGVKSLIERFMKHSASKKKCSKAQTVELNLISSEKNTVGGILDVKHETLKVVLTGDDDIRSEQKPGARLKLLKDELNRQMRKLKGEEWQKRQEEMKNDQVFEGEKDDCGMLPDEGEEEEDMTDSESESEPEINDVREPKRKKKVKSLFVDEEAEVDDDQDDNADSDEKEDSDEDEKDNDGGEEAEQNFDAHNGSDSEEDIEGKTVSDRASPYVQDEHSLRDFEADEKDDHESNNAISRDIRRSMTSADLFASQSTEWRVDDDDDYIPAGQPNGVARQEILKEKSDDTRENSLLFSPMSLSLPGKRPSFMDAANERTPTKFSWPMEAKTPDSIKKLFSEPEISGTQELAGLFAGKFNDSQDEISKLANTPNNTESESDLMALCSGKFMTQLPQPEDLEEDCAQASLSDSELLSQMQREEPSQASTLPVEDSQDFSLKWNENSKKEQDHEPESKDETNKFELEIMSSDEEDESFKRKEKKKKHRKLDFSDDEGDDQGKNTDADSVRASESSDDNEDAESVSHEATETGEKKLFGVFQKPTQEVFYDSDENEIEAADFFENEAELSDEEDFQGSDDEDEKGLDQMEMDEADKEDIDQDAVREQLLKNHMQKMLDEDRRDVRILKEMLLEDGELHSETGGRERQFRWKNVDSTGMGDDGQKSDEEHGDNDEEEDDAEWRKQRHEREMFLKEQREKAKKEAGELEDDDEVLENSELLQLGKAVLCKSRSNSFDMTCAKEPQVVNNVNNQLLSPDGKRPKLLVSKRGSFLSRGDSVLAKLAKFTGPMKENVLAGAKSGGNFVFTAVSPPKKEIQTDGDQDSKTMKRKASIGIAHPKDKKPCLVASVRKRSGLFDQL